MVSVKGTNTYNLSRSGGRAVFEADASVVTLRSVMPGSYLRLRPIGGDKYLIVERIGAWIEV